MAIGDHTYDPETGKFYNKQGRLVGNYTRTYGRICLEGKNVCSSRYAVYLMTGKWPVGEVDHINGDTHDDRWSNLRECSRGENMCNRRLYKTSTSNYKGVNWDRGKYVASIQVDKKRRYLGRDSDPAICALMYDHAAKELHGEFARLNFPQEATTTCQV